MIVRSPLVLVFLLSAACDKDAPPPGAPEPEPAEVVSEDVETSEPARPAGNANVKLALGGGEEATFCCEAGRGEEGTGCRQESSTSATEECLREGLFAFTCTGTVVDCTDGACACGEPTSAGRRLCCTEVEGNQVRQCSEWNDSDYTACVDNGRVFKMCANPKCGDGKTGLDCTCD